MLLHGGDQDLAGQVRVLLGEGAHQDVGPLGQVDHFVHQLGGGNGLEAALAAGFLHGLEHQLPAALLGGDDAGLLQHLQVRGRLAHHVGVVGEEAVARR